MAIESQKDIALLKKRLTELAAKAYERNLYVYTEFLGLAEQSVLHEMERELQYAGVRLQGSCNPAEGDSISERNFAEGKAGEGISEEGSWKNTEILADNGPEQLTERKMVRFGTEEQCGYREEFPIVAMAIKPLQKKFAEDLTHRDFLGALMHLGMDRNRLGDLFVQDKEAILFCQEGVADFLMQELNRVRHTEVKCSYATREEIQAICAVETEEKVLQVSSGRIDACISRLYNMSRNDSLELFKQGKVYVNGKLCESNSYLLKESDAVTARGFGKFVFRGVTGETRKGKLCVTVKVYGKAGLHK